MKRKTPFFASIFLFVSFISFAQNDAYKALLKHTSIVIHAAQKHMIAAGKTDVGGLLAKSVLLQSHAVKIYRQKNEKNSACSSAKARELAAEIIKKIGGKENAYYLVSDEEKKLLGNCSGEAELLKEGKKNLKTLSENDKDYADPKSLNATNIDIK